jgi:L-cysteine/cystine lyase
VPDPLSTSPKVLSHRAGLPSLAAGIQLNTGSLGPLPAEVAAAMEELARYERDFGRAQLEYFLESLQRMDEARAGVAAVLGGGLDEIALTHATTDGMNIGAWTLDWRAGDRIVTTSQEHAGALGPLHAIRDRLGVQLDFVDVPLDADDDAIVAGFDAAVLPGTRLVALSHVLWTTGRVMPVARIAALVRDRGAVVLVDGAQAAGAIPVSVEDLGADLYAVPAQKWLLGPEGMGALWVSPVHRPGALAAFAGYASWSSHDGRGAHVAHPGARALEASAFHRPSVLGMARAIGWLTMFVGLPWAHERAAALAAHAADRLAAMPGAALLTPRERMATLVTFRLPAWDAAAAADELAARTFAILRTIPSLDALRISVGWFTTIEELDRFLDGVALLAAHTPETVPPRRTLPILGID